MKQTGRGHGRAVRRAEEPAARLLPLRRPRLHAGHDGHRPQHRPQRGPPRRPHRQDRQRALRLGQLPPLRPDVRRRRPRPQAAVKRDRPFEKIMDELKHAQGRQARHRSDRRGLKELVQRFKTAVKERKGKDFPDDPMEQMWGAIGAVFGSWNNDRAIVYRRQYGIPDDWGTAANICSMVFGNMGDDCGTGVAFTRDPATGENVFYGEYLINAQGEDVVAGIRTPKKIAELQERHARGLQAARGDPQEAGKALPRRAGHRVHHPEGQALDAADAATASGRRLRRSASPWTWSRRGSSTRRRPSAGRSRAARPAPHPTVDPKPGSWMSSPRACLPRRARRWAGSSSPPTRPKSGPLGVRRSSWSANETSPEDIGGMHAADGILTARGGISHAALVARGMGKCCVAGAGDIRIDFDEEGVTVGPHASRRATSSPRRVTGEV